MTNTSNSRHGLERLNTATVSGVHELLQRYVEMMGLVIEESHGSQLSSSKYLVVRHITEHDEDGEPNDWNTYKIRISNHVLPPTYKLMNGEADYEVSPAKIFHDDKQGNWYNAIEWLHRKTGKPMPPAARRLFNEWKTLKEQADAERARQEQEARDRYLARLTGEREPIRKLETWLSTLPVDAEISVSRSGNVVARWGADGDGWSDSFGPKPYGFSKSIKTVVEAKYFIDSKKHEFDYADKRLKGPAESAAPDTSGIDEPSHERPRG